MTHRKLDKRLKQRDIRPNEMPRFTGGAPIHKNDRPSLSDWVGAAAAVFERIASIRKIFKKKPSSSDFDGPRF